VAVNKPEEEQASPAEAAIAEPEDTAPQPEEASE
jgi:hypothetical protein